MALQWSAGKGCDRITRECVKKKRKRHNHQRIKLKGSDDVTVNETMQSTRAAATRTGESGNGAKWTSREKTGLAWFKDE